MSVQGQLDQAARERAVLKAAHKRAQIVNGVLYGFTFLLLALGVSLYSHLQENREQRVVESAQSDLITCSRANYQDVRDRLQDGLLLDLLTASRKPPKVQARVFNAGEEQLAFRLKNQPPSVATLLERWRGNPVSEEVLKQRQMDAAGPQARAEARERGDFIKPPVDCDTLPSQRPFKR